MIICDFCSTPNPTWRYPAKSFEAEQHGNVHINSEGDWAACDECHRLIQTGNREGLLTRTAQTYQEMFQTGEPLGYLFQMFQAMHAKFFANRVGEPVRVEEEACP